MKKEFFEKGILTVCLAAGMILGSGFCSLAAVLPDGLQVGGQELGGLSREEADRKIEEYVDGLPDQTISIQVGDQTLETTTKAMGLSWSNRDAVDEVVSALTEGTLLKRYMAETDLDIKVVQYVMGHVKISVTMDVYNHVTDQVNISRYGGHRYAFEVHQYT